MNRRFGLLSGLLLVALVLAAVMPVSGAAQAQSSLSRVRFLHAVPGASAIDVYVDGVLAVEGLGFGEVTPHLNVEGGEHAVEVRTSGLGASAPVLLTVSVPLVPNLAFTVIVEGTADALSTALYEDILDEIGAGFARLTAINAIADAPALDVVTTEGGPLLQGVSYGSQFGTVNITAGTQELVMVPAGGAVESAVVSIGNVALTSGMLYTFVALGTLDGAVAPSALVLATPVNGTTDTVLVQVGHGSPDAPAVDVYAGDMLIAPALELGDLTGHIALPAGSYTMALRTAGAPAADAPLVSADVTLSADAPAVTLVATGQVSDGTLALSVFTDNVAGLTSTEARVAVINAVPGAEVSSMMSDETLLASSLASNAQGDVASVAPGSYMLIASVQGVDNPVDIIVPDDVYIGGMYYTVLVYGGGVNNAGYDAHVSGMPVDVMIDSLPVSEGAAMAAVPEATEAAPAVDAAPAEVVTEEPTPVPAEVVPSETEVVATADTELVSASETEVVTAADAAAQTTPQPVTAASAVPIAYVELDPSANLQCRELPGSDMRSLGLIPGGTTLTVLGRTGEPLVPETGGATPEPTPVVEAIEDLWLSVQWDTADGGYLRCWVAAEFLRVEYRGKLLDTLEELWELPEQPFNLAGENTSTNVTAPTPLFDAVIATVNLELGVSLQLRRHPKTDAESLGLVPALAQLEVLGYAEAPSEGLVGQPTDPYWYYVRYMMEDGGATVGWVSGQYVTLSRLGHEVLLEEISLVDVSEAGYFEAPGSVAIAAQAQKILGTVDLNQGANLNLRDRPSADARVVLGIPSGDSLEIDGRNGDGSWVHGKYASSAGEVEGWVATQYLVIVQGSQEYDVSKLEILTGEADTAGLEATATVEPSN